MFHELWYRWKAWWHRRRADRQLVYRVEVDDIERLALGFVLKEEFRRLRESTLPVPGLRLLPPVTTGDHVLKVILWILVSFLLLVLALALSFDIARALGNLPSTPLS